MPAASASNLTYHAEPDLLLVRWHAESAPEILPAEYEAVLARAGAHGQPRLLLDVRRRPAPPLEATNWIMLNWLPRAAVQFAPAVLRVAYLISAERARLYADDAFLRSQLHDALAPNRAYHVAVFGDEAAARQWLLKAEGVGGGEPSGTPG